MSATSQATYFNIEGSYWKQGDSGYSRNHCQADPGRREGFSGTPESNRNFPYFRCSGKRSIWRNPLIIRIGETEYPLHTRYIPGGTTSYTAANAGTACWRLRRYDDTARSNACVNRPSGPSDTCGVSPQPAAFVQPHLFRGQSRRQLDCTRPDDGKAFGLVTTHSLEKSLRD